MARFRLTTRSVALALNSVSPRHRQPQARTRQRDGEGWSYPVDLGLYGDDLYELIIWIFREFGVEPNINIADFAPGESFLFRLPASWKRQRNRGRYGSLKIRDIISAIEAGRWQPPVGTDASTPIKID
jgi:hypothetical protein